MANPRKYLETDQLEESGHLKILENNIVYIQRGKKYKISDPEEGVRAP